MNKAYTEGMYVAFAKLGTLKWTGGQIDEYAAEVQRMTMLSDFTGENLLKGVQLTFVNGFPDTERYV